MKATTARVWIRFFTAIAYVRIAIFVIAGLALACWGLEHLLRRDPTSEALSTLDGVLLEARAPCSKKWHDFEASLQTSGKTLHMTLPCYDDVDRRALGKTLTVRYENGTDLVGIPYQTVWEMRTPAHVYLTFAQRQNDEHSERWTDAFEVLGGLLVAWMAAMPEWWRRWLSP